MFLAKGVSKIGGSLRCAVLSAATDGVQGSDWRGRGFVVSLGCGPARPTISHLLHTPGKSWPGSSPGTNNYDERQPTTANHSGS